MFYVCVYVYSGVWSQSHIARFRLNRSQDSLKWKFRSSHFFAVFHPILVVLRAEKRTRQKENCNRTVKRSYKSYWILPSSMTFSDFQLFANFIFLSMVIGSDRRSENLGQKMIPSDRRSEKCAKIDRFKSPIWTYNCRFLIVSFSLSVHCNVTHVNNSTKQ